MTGLKSRDHIPVTAAAKWWEIRERNKIDNLMKRTRRKLKQWDGKSGFHF